MWNARFAEWMGRSQMGCKDYMIALEEGQRAVLCMEQVDGLYWICKWSGRICIGFTYTELKRLYWYWYDSRNDCKY